MKSFNKFFIAILSLGIVCSSQVVAQEITQEDNTEQDLSSSQPLPIYYTWTDFLAKKDCLPFVKSLETNSEHQDLYQNLKSYCLNNNGQFWDDLLGTFRKEKRTLLINQTLNQGKSYVRYLKALPYFLFDIQDTKSFGNQPKNILDKIEQAIIDHQIETSASLVDTLPEIWKNGLKSTQVLTQKLLNLKQQLDNFGSEKGDAND